MRLGPVVRHDLPRQAKIDLPHTNDGLPHVLVARPILTAMYQHAIHGFPLEIGGYLVGAPIVDSESNQRCTLLHTTVEGRCISTRTHVTLLPEGMGLLHQVCQEREELLVGYYHSHPGFGVFQSGEDLDTFKQYYPEGYQVAIVVDPTKATIDALGVGGSWIGFFVWGSNGLATKLDSTHIHQVSEPVAEALLTKPEKAYVEPPGDLVVSSDLAEIPEEIEAPPIAEPKRRGWQLPAAIRRLRVGNRGTQRGQADFGDGAKSP